MDEDAPCPSSIDSDDAYVRALIFRLPVGVIGESITCYNLAPEKNYRRANRHIVLRASTSTCRC